MERMRTPRTLQTVYLSVQLVEQWVGEGTGGTHSRAWQENETGWGLGFRSPPWPRGGVGLLRTSLPPPRKCKGRMPRLGQPVLDVIFLCKRLNK